ncbi:MAG: ABC transporter permease subunit [Acidimicrobiia bacterium]|nr:ABC transporter permease subunit [Acidimicrobiia bacterium]
MVEPAGELAESSSRLPRRYRTIISFTLIILALAVLWESYKWMGQTTGGVWPGTNLGLPVRTNNRAMPHLWDIVAALFRPARRGGDEILFITLLKAAMFTFRSAFAGFVVGSAFGFGLAIWFIRSPLAERGLMPYVVASQTVPLIAIAPMVVIWGGQAGLPTWLAVAVISSYLSFFPVAINSLRGLRSPPATASELMRSYAATPHEVLTKLQIPAALPFLFPALKIAATASVIGAIIGELPAGLSVGLGRALLSFASSFSSAPEKLFGAVLLSSLLGVVFVGLVALAERRLIPESRRVADIPEFAT